MEISVEEKGEFIKHKGNKSTLNIKVKIKDLEGKPIEKYQIDRIVALDEPPKNWLQKIIAYFNKKKNTGEICVENPETPNVYGDKPVEEILLDKKTTILSEPIKDTGEFPCTAEVKNKNFKDKNKYKMDLTLITENNGEIKRRVIIKQGDNQSQDSKLKKGKGWYTRYLTFIFFISTAVLMLWWNLTENSNIYDQPFPVSHSVINFLIGCLTGFFGITLLGMIVNIISAMYQRKSIKTVASFPEVYLEPFIIKKLGKGWVLLSMVIIFLVSIMVMAIFRSVPLPLLPTDDFAYYDYEKEVEINTPRKIYRKDFSKVRVGLNKYLSKRKPPLYFANLAFDKSGKPYINYKNYSINVKGREKDIPFQFKVFYNPQLLEDYKDYRDYLDTLYSHVRGKKNGTRDAKYKCNLENDTFFIEQIEHLSGENIADQLTNFSEKEYKRNTDFKTILSERDPNVIAYNNFFEIPSGVVVRANELVDRYEEYMGEMGNGLQSAIKRSTLIWCQFNVSKEYHIDFLQNDIERIIGPFEKFYKKYNVVSNVSKKLTQVYIRLLLKIERDFARECNIFHQAISRVLEDSGGEFYLLYLEECIRNDLLSGHEEDNEPKTLRMKYFEGKLGTIRKLGGWKQDLERIAIMVKTGHTRRFLDGLISQPCI